MESLSKEKFIYEYMNVMQEAFSCGKTFRLPVIGKSMEPTLFEGDAVILSPPQDLKRGDIVLYHSTGNSFILHRIAKVNDNLSLIGDNNLIMETISPSDIVAKVTSLVRRGKTIDRKSVKYNFLAFSARLRRLLKRVKRKVTKNV